MLKPRKFTLIVAAAILAGLAATAIIVGWPGGNLVCDSTNTTVVPTFPEVVELPRNDFDASVGVPGSSVVVYYPKGGFYGQGVKIYPELGDKGQGEVGGVGIVPDVGRDEESLSSLSVGVRSLNEPLTLKDALEQNLLAPMIVATRDMEFGSYVSVGGNEFFVAKDSAHPTINLWRAIATNNDEIITVAFTVTDGLDSFSHSAFRNSDQLFLQILSHLKFE
jgi:hypothetical protein